MCNNIFQEIDSLHSEWSMMDKASRLGWLTGERIRLNQLVAQFAQYINVKGGFSNDDERTYARKLIEMTQVVEMEGEKISNDLANEVIRELVKGLMR